MNKILIIGQSPPAKTQTVPYDTTMLYIMLEWVGVTKEQAQELFTFESVSTVVPGKYKGGSNMPPAKEDMINHWPQLKAKIKEHDRMLILGKVAFDWIAVKHGAISKVCYYLTHPSRRNYSRIMADKANIKQKLFELLNP